MRKDETPDRGSNDRENANWMDFMFVQDQLQCWTIFDHFQSTASVGSFIPRVFQH